MTDNEPYASDIEYLSNKIARGEKISSSDRIFQKLDGKRNISSVQAFLSKKVDGNMAD